LEICKSSKTFRTLISATPEAIAGQGLKSGGELFVRDSFMNRSKRFWEVPGGSGRLGFWAAQGQAKLSGRVQTCSNNAGLSQTVLGLGLVSLFYGFARSFSILGSFRCPTQAFVCFCHESLAWRPSVARMSRIGLRPKVWIQVPWTWFFVPSSLSMLLDPGGLSGQISSDFNILLCKHADRCSAPWTPEPCTDKLELQPLMDVLHCRTLADSLRPGGFVIWAVGSLVYEMRGTESRVNLKEKVDKMTCRLQQFWIIWLCQTHAASGSHVPALPWAPNWDTCYLGARCGASDCCAWN
jgi:hypothetical protein